MLEPADSRPMTMRENEVRRFVHTRFGLRGTLKLHRAALGADLLRAPVNVMLSPVFLFIRLVVVILRLFRARRVAEWLAARKIFLTSDLARQVETDLTALLARLDAQKLAPDASPETTKRAIAAYAETRNAVSEITTTLIVLIAGYLIFYRPTPGILSLAEPVAQMRAQSRAIEEFALGGWAGQMWYGLFPTQLSTVELVFTTIALSVGASVVTTFAGLIADPVQLWTGIHKRRLMRMLVRLDRQQESGAIAREHVLARLGDLGDIASSIWRGMR
ncbi:DUF6635 family protein [Paracoccus aestuariivivens]|uniref:Uncharacterized protein n=1 Tax=Paracoccus aestuariivivens TaxID=1820333 RepID=A0A6L6J4W2_9RHOB|nr:DUF6635 family protein [Paracoccus aestuariivivens]MTH77142.1 hypothetical protein [Paracoccus aestuariivivens]